MANSRHPSPPARGFSVAEFDWRARLDDLRRDVGGAVSSVRDSVAGAFNGARDETAKTGAALERDLAGAQQAVDRFVTGAKTDFTTIQTAADRSVESFRHSLGAVDASLDRQIVAQQTKLDQTIAEAQRQVDDLARSAGSHAGPLAGGLEALRARLDAQIERERSQLDRTLTNARTSIDRTSATVSLAAETVRTRADAASAAAQHTLGSVQGDVDASLAADRARVREFAARAETKLDVVQTSAEKRFGQLEAGAQALDAAARAEIAAEQRRVDRAIAEGRRDIAAVWQQARGDVDRVRGEVARIETAVETNVANIERQAVDRITGGPEMVARDRAVTAAMAKYDQVYANPHVLDQNLADGAIVHVDGTADPTSLHPSPNLDPNARYMYVNGIETAPNHAASEVRVLSEHLGYPVDLVYVKKEAGGAMDPVNTAVEIVAPDIGAQHPPEQSLKNAIKETVLDEGRNIYIAGYSRGALVTELALKEVRKELLGTPMDAQGHVWTDAAIRDRIMSRVYVETENGASHRMPDGVRQEHFAAASDVLVAQVFGKGQNALTAVTHGILDGVDNGSFATMTAIRTAMSPEAARIASDLGALQRDQYIAGVAPAASTEMYQRDLASFSRDVVKLQGVLEKNIASEFAPENSSGKVTTTPFQTTRVELSHNPDDYKGVGGVVAVLKAGTIGVLAQHEFGGAMMDRPPEMQMDRSDLTPAQLRAEKVAEHVPALSARGTPMPPVNSVEPWNGKQIGGTIFKIDDHTYAIHSGQGTYQTLDVKNDLHGVEPPSGAAVQIGAGGHVRVETMPFAQGQQHGQQLQQAYSR